MQTENSSKQAENTESISMTQLLIHVFLDYLYELFIITPYLILKRFIHHPLFMSLVLVVVFPLLLFIRIVVGIWNFISSSTPTTNKKPLNRERNESRMFHTFDDSEEDELNQWQERCSICFESKLDLCLGYCRDQFCIDCFQQYVSEVVKSSWGLCITKIRCPVCRVHIPQAEWSRYVPAAITDLYNKFNQPYRNFTRCCPRCETEVAPCNFEKTHHLNRSQHIGEMIKELTGTLIPSTAINTSYRTFQRTFERLEWRNSNLPDIHLRLINYFKGYCTTLQDNERLKDISRQVLQLEMKPTTWRKLQFSFIALFPFDQCPTCENEFCLQCGYDAHIGLTCEENMKQLVNQQQQTQDDTILVLQWKLENSRRCPNCSIMINRDEGCNKVDCSLCGFSFCWGCGSSWSDSCGFFHCSVLGNRENSDSVNNEDPADGSTSLENNNNIPRTEIGVPNIAVIQARLHSNA